MLQFGVLSLLYKRTAMKHASKTLGDYQRALLMGGLMGAALAVMFCAGFFLRDFVDINPVQAASVSEEAGEYLLLDEVQRLLDAHYLNEQPSYQARQYSAIRGLLGALGDQNTFFIEPPVAASESQALAGTYGGIGVTVQRNAGGQFVLFPFPEGPAAEAGIQDNDVLLAVNGETLDVALGQDAVDQLLRGEVSEGSGVEITVLRGDEEVTEFILFDVINIPSVQWRVLAEDGRLGYIHIMRFTARTPEEVRQADAMLRGEGVDALVLDLRNNGGGLLDESVIVASEFLADGNVFREITLGGERIYDVREGGLITDLPLVVLVNGGTASAAELVAGAIQDQERGILIGQRTYGKGTIQQIFSLSDGSSIHVTTAEWFTPDNHVLDRVGLTPDIEMIPDETGRDIELAEAVRHLQEQLDETS
jgi:carboxyl-terminal processing protease